MTKLKLLDLAGNCRVSEFGLNFLATLTDLRCLNMAGTFHSCSKLSNTSHPAWDTWIYVTIVGDTWNIMHLPSSDMHSSIYLAAYYHII